MSPAATGPPLPWSGFRRSLVALALCGVAVVPAQGHAGAARTVPERTVLVMGDSLIASALPDLTADLRPSGWRVLAPDAVPGAGLLDSDVDWLAKAEEHVARVRPAVAVVEYTGNYGDYGGEIAGVRFASKAFYARWRATAQRLEDELAADGATVYWVLGPPLRPARAEAARVVIDRLYAGLRAPDTASGRPPLIDVTPALTGGTGRFRTSVPGPNGSAVKVRRSDGIHLTPAGQKLFAAVVARAVAGASRPGAPRRG